MDQLKTAGLWLRKNYFWLSCALVTVIALGMWFMTTGKLSRETKTRTNELAGKKRTADTLVGEPNHPNTFTNVKMDQVVKEVSEDVYLAWVQQYDRQRAVLEWPKDILGNEFVQKVQELQPIEAKVKFGSGSEVLRPDERSRYRNFIYTRLPKLAEIIGAQWRSKRTAGGTGAGGATMSSGTGVAAMGANMMSAMNNNATEGDSDAIVEWVAGNQGAIENGRFAWRGEPTTLEILYAQEDYWALRSIMEIIKATNGDVEHRYQAAVKTIQSIDIGRDALGLSSASMGGMGGMGAGTAGDSRSMSVGAMMGGGMGSGPASSGGGLGSSSSGGIMAGASSVGGGVTDTAPTVDPGDNRYVDLKFKELTAAQIRSALTSNNPNDAFLMVAKRMPVRMRLVVDQRKLPKLLAEMGNASLPVEIKQLKVGNIQSSSGGASMMPSGGSGSGAGGGSRSSSGMMPGNIGGASSGGGSSASMSSASMSSGAMSSASMGSGAMRSSGGGSASGMMMGGAGSAGGASDESPFDINVELYGIIYLYNPVDLDKLGKKLEEAPAQPAQPATEATTPDTAGNQENQQPVPAAG
jgi:hypothetical protein